MTNPENQSSIFGVNVSSISTSNGGMSANQPIEPVVNLNRSSAVYDSTFN